MKQHKSSNQLKVDGKMTSKGADKVGFMQALALMGFSLASIILAVSLLLYVLK